MVRGIRLLLVLAAVTARPGAALGLQPEDLAESWRWRRFDREEGLPSGSIFAIGHDRDDFLYVGTARGLLRYNGFTWAPLETEGTFDAGAVERIAESGGDVYVSTRKEIWIARFGLELHRLLRGGRFLLAAGPLGGIYAVDAEARIHYHMEKETAGRIDEGMALPREEITDFAVDDRRIHWLATQEGPYRRNIQTGFRWQIDPDLPPELRGRPCLRLFVLKRQAIVRTVVAAPVPASPPAFELWALFGSAPGPAAGGAGPGAGDASGTASGGVAPPRFLLARKGETEWRVSGIALEGSTLADLVIDGSGSYIAVEDQGVVHVSADGAAWSSVTQPEFIPGTLSGGVLDPHGYLWFRAGTAAVFRFDGLGRRWERYWRELGLPSNNILSLIQASDRKIWAGTENGIYAYPPGYPNNPVVYHQIGTTALRSITGIAEDKTGKIWISSSEAFKGTFYFQDGVWHRLESSGGAEADPGLAGQFVRRIVADRSGDLWFLPAGQREEKESAAGKTSPYRIWRYSSSYSQGSFKAVEIPCGPASDLLHAQDRSRWLATDQGLLWISASQEDFRIYTEAQGLRSSRIWAIAEASDGAIWVCYDPSAASGVTRIHEGEMRTFDERDGLASPNARSVACAVSPEGSDVWFGTDRGIIRFDGDCWYNYPLASLHRRESEVWPLVIVGARQPRGAFDGESVLVGTTGQGIFRFRLDDRRRPRITSLDISRAPGNLFTFHWDGRDFKNESLPSDLRFRTRIDDQPWSPFSIARSLAATELAPGEHTFHVEVRDLDGNSNREQYFKAFKVPVLPASMVSPLVLAALSGAGFALAAAALVFGLLWRSRRRQGPDWAAAGAGTLFADFPGAVLAIDANGRILAVSGRRPGDLGLPGAPGPELAGCPAEILPVLQGESARGSLARLLAGEPAVLEGVPIGSSGRVAAVTGFPLPGGKGGPAGALVLVEETTDLGRAREMRDRSRRLQALQDLAERLVGELAPAAGDPRVAPVVEALRAFAGGGPASPLEPVDLAGLLEGLLARGSGGAPGTGWAPIHVPQGIEVALSGQAGLWRIRGGREALRLALAEVLRNAMDAMPGGGRLAVRLRNRRLEADAGDLPAGPYVEAEVQDGGAGISPAEAGRAFDPFYSTKARDRSRGVGLSIAFGIVRRHRGDIRMASMPGAGTTVTVLLPADPSA